MCKISDEVTGVWYEGVCGSGGLINILLVLAQCGGSYFILCSRCSTALS